MNRRFPVFSFLLTILIIFTVSSVLAQGSFRTKTKSFKTKGSGNNLCINGDCEDPDDPLKGWTIDFDWNGLSQNRGNQAEFVKSETGRRNVVKLLKKTKEAPIISPLVDFEYGKTYTVSFDVKTIGKTAKHHRLYVKGFKWKSGIRPYDNPHVGDLQLIYKGKHLPGAKSSWKRMTTQFPMLAYEDMSSLAKKNLKYVRKIGVYTILTVDAKGDSAMCFDNVVIKQNK